LPAEAKAGRVYRLPTEAEWEFACRAGTTTDFSFGDDGNQVGDYGWFRNNSGRVELDADSLLECDEDKDVMQLLENGCQTHPVGHKRPNAWGLFDMYGNVREWCSDWYGAYPEEPDAVFDPEGPTEGSFRVSRGGCWFEQGKWCRSASRHWNTPSSRTAGLGLRLIFTQESPAKESRVLNNA
jgi:formylglycine-generating enzyme required for sulfatase activity